MTLRSRSEERVSTRILIVQRIKYDLAVTQYLGYASALALTYLKSATQRNISKLKNIPLIRAHVGAPLQVTKLTLLSRHA